VYKLRYTRVKSGKTIRWGLGRTGKSRKKKKEEETHSSSIENPDLYENFCSIVEKKHQRGQVIVVGHDTLVE